MPTRHREEVLNTVLAEAIVARGLNASPEAIKRGGAQRPDVIMNFRGLRCAVEGKIDDVQDARTVVLGDATRRVETGISQIAVAVVYPQSLRGTTFSRLHSSMSSAELQFAVCSERGHGEWKSGSVDAILAELRRAHELIASDDAVRQAAEELSMNLTEVANVFMEDGAVCDRLVELLGIGEPEKEDHDDTD